ncbi:MAG: stage IV sporulation protein A, partial [Clostridia bacterium]
MENFDLYEDIAKRTNGDVYIGVVGPVRCGKSTFITKFMKTMVLGSIEDKNVRQRAIDEMPQSADGKMIMTTQPKFVPNDAVKIKIDGKNEVNVRMIDCVGYLIDGATGHIENERPRKVKTPWSDEEMPFEDAAEIGTRKVIEEHSSIAVAMTTDGSISEIPRSNYVAAEEKIVEQLKLHKKPFVLVVNSKNPKSEQTQKLSESLSKKYGVPTLAIDVINLSEENVKEIFEKVLLEFPLKSLEVNMPTWMSALSFEDPIIQEVIKEIKDFGGNITKIGEVDKSGLVFLASELFEPISLSKIKMGEGKLSFDILPKADLFYKVLSTQCGTEISDDYHLVNYIKQLAYAKSEYDKIKSALDDVNEKGYGVVMPKLEEMSLEDPQIVKQGSRFGVKLKASAPSLHIMRVDIETEINPLVGTEQQSEELVKYLMSEFENDPSAIWETNMFGKSLH